MAGLMQNDGLEEGRREGWRRDAGLSKSAIEPERQLAPRELLLLALAALFLFSSSSGISWALYPSK